MAFQKEHNLCQDYCYKQNQGKTYTTWNLFTRYVTIYNTTMNFSIKEKCANA